MSATAPTHRAGRPRPAETAATVAILCALATPALAGQAGLTLTAQSDYRVRGVSYTRDRAALSAALSYDADNGLYADLTGVAAGSGGAGDRPLGYQADVGWARRLDDGLTLDLGLTATGFDARDEAGRKVRYTEAYVGLISGGLSAHLFLSPDYLGGKPSAYAEVDGSMRPAPHLRLFAHAGVLAPLRPARYELADPAGPRLDLRAGAAVEVRKLELQLAWTRVFGGEEYASDSSAVVVSAGWSF